MNAKCVSYPKVSFGLGFKNLTQEDQNSNQQRQILMEMA
ncbi:hypothetical protein MICAH_4250005 [Microcystis aeruginosa PCC 9809]|jgi:hypothetical protein|uniref:Uncharacterized protein n=1 Tax=Microcystis aeruginosa PCC 9809 TaxID=1160285 RepID=I4HYI2_MICAE|nr:hypothetical protein MICAH_4250005 [Microcystis aeruginosa PCC 9809]